MVLITAIYVETRQYGCADKIVIGYLKNTITDKIISYILLKSYILFKWALTNNWWKNCDWYLAMIETIQLNAKENQLRLIWNVTNKIFTNNHICLIYMYKHDLALNNQQWLICHKTKPNQIYTDRKNDAMNSNACI